MGRMKRLLTPQSLGFQLKVQTEGGGVLDPLPILRTTIALNGV